jgi:hypothetical protein
MPTIGVLGTASAAAWSAWTAAFVLQLRELGWIDGRTVAIEYRWADERNERFAEIAAEFVQLKADVILTSGGAGFAAKAGYLDDPDRHRLARSRRDKRCDAALADARSTLLRLLALHSSGSHTRARPN